MVNTPPPSGVTDNARSMAHRIDKLTSKSLNSVKSMLNKVEQPVKMADFEEWTSKFEAVLPKMEAVLPQFEAIFPKFEAVLPKFDEMSGTLKRFQEGLTQMKENMDHLKKDLMMFMKHMTSHGKIVRGGISKPNLRPFVSLVHFHRRKRGRAEIPYITSLSSEIEGTADTFCVCGSTAGKLCRAHA
ncbi:hypothetical protein BWQ96_04718 [Gracilariopsis chorda]|uniref:Uncharacterized protein n=1 Tax=Gracilariopsis chorda TaxID=448386 RepID=A0A2V3ITR2_9FLOR|nr:hypothetical protein BWQ96_04707 [Gracilariopsis chorda]PXF45516.1 hypothetical protein BWQ96_04718 [Gracilariopsis chorda]|eukprot:PXF45505.1 hypothetical protein BWQ96_04707 [Gracilariopsis chorda]